MKSEPDSPEEQRRFKALARLSRTARGALIDLAITVESILDDIVALYFTRADRADAFLPVLRGPGVTFDVKIRFAVAVIERQALFEVDTIRAPLQKLRDLRNKLAHSRLIAEDSDPQTGVLVYGYFEKGQEQRLRVDSDRLAKWEREAEDLAGHLYLAGLMMQSGAFGYESEE